MCLGLLVLHRLLLHATRNVGPQLTVLVWASGREAFNPVPDVAGSGRNLLRQFREKSPKPFGYRAVPSVAHVLLRCSSCKHVERHKVSEARWASRYARWTSRDLRALGDINRALDYPRNLYCRP